MPNNNHAALTDSSGEKHRAEVIGRFDAFTPSVEERDAMQEMREKTAALAAHIVDTTPRSREQSLAITALEEVKYWTNQNIARNGVLPGPGSEPTA